MHLSQSQPGTVCLMDLLCSVSLKCWCDVHRQQTNERRCQQTSIECWRQVGQPPCTPNVPAAIHRGISRPTATGCPLFGRWRRGLPKHAGTPSRLRHRDGVARHVLAAAIAQGGGQHDGLGQRIPHLGQLQPRHASGDGSAGWHVTARGSCCVLSMACFLQLVVGQCSPLPACSPPLGRPCTNRGRWRQRRPPHGR